MKTLSPLALEKRRAAGRRRYQENPQIWQDNARQWYYANRERINAQRRAFNAAHPEIKRIKRFTLETRIKNMLYRASQDSRHVGIPFDLKLEDLGLPTACAVTGLPFELDKSAHKGGNFAPSLDRIVPELGYVRGNVRIVVHCYNLAKLAGTDADVLKMARALVARTAS